MPVILHQFLELMAPFEGDQTGPTFNPQNVVFDINAFLYVRHGGVQGPGVSVVTYDDIELSLSQEDMHQPGEAFVNELCK